jgi:uncharacterized protein (DUF885 family)
MMRRWVLLLVVSTGCGEARRVAPPAPTPAPTPAAPAPKGPDAQLDDLAREYVDGLLAASPTTATWLGAHGADDRLDDVSADAQAREAARLRALSTRLRAIPEAELDATHRLDRALLERELRLGLIDLVDARTLERNPLRYVDLASSGVEELLAHDFAPLPDRLRAIDARLLKLRGLFDEARKNLKNPPELCTRKAIDLLGGARTFVAETLPKAVSAVGDERLQAEFKVAQGDALRALDDFAAWMQRDLLPRSKGELALGPQRLAEWLRAAELVDVPLDRLLAVGERELKQLRARWEEAARELGKPPLEVARTLEDDHAAAEELVPSVATSLDRIASFVRDKKLLTLPPGGPKVAEMPPFLWGYASLSSAGSLETRVRDAFFYVDPVDRGWNKKRREDHLRALNRAQLELTALHEVYPGHFVQGEAARRAPSTIERVAQSGAFVEGWAHYAERLAIAQGYGDEHLELAALREALTRACRLVAALKLHAFGAKLDDAVKIFTDEGYLDDLAARREAERGAYDPAYLAHALGRLEIEKLRDDYRAARGEAFSLAEFHDKLLAHGAAPVPLLRKLLLPGDAGPPL